MAVQTRTRLRHERILDAALDVFTTHGYRDAAVDDIAQAANTSKGGLYFHFPGKQAIFLALLERSSRLLLSRVEESIATVQDPVQKLDAALLALFHVFSSHRTLARLFLVELTGAGPEFRARMVEIHGQFESFIRRNLDDAVAQGAIEPLDTAVASVVWFGALHHVVSRWALSDRPAPLDADYAPLRTLLLRSIGAASSSGMPEVRA